MTTKKRIIVKWSWAILLLISTKSINTVLLWIALKMALVFSLVHLRKKTPNILKTRISSQLRFSISLARMSFLTYNNQRATFFCKHHHFMEAVYFHRQTSFKWLLQLSLIIRKNLQRISQKTWLSVQSHLNRICLDKIVWISWWNSRRLLHKLLY